MKKRSAILLALGLVGALAVGGSGVTLGLTGLSTSEASPRTTHAKPIVKTVRRTTTVHRKAPAGPAVVIAGQAASGPSVSAGSSTSAWSDDDGEFENEFENENEVENEVETAGDEGHDEHSGDDLSSTP
jgi:hypothetical protein